jgi:hypothetical protein
MRLVPYRAFILGALFCGVLLDGYFTHASPLSTLVVTLIYLGIFTCFTFSSIRGRDKIIGKLEKDADAYDRILRRMEEASLRAGENLAAGVPVPDPEEEKP